MPYHEHNAQDLIDHEDEILVPSSNIRSFVALFTITCSLYFGLRISEWWFAPPPVSFPPPIVTVEKAVTVAEAFPGGNYYVVPPGLTCSHKRFEHDLLIVCRPAK